MSDELRAAVERMREYKRAADAGEGLLEWESQNDDIMDIVYDYLALFPADDGESMDGDWLIKVGFAGGNDEPNTDVYRFDCGACLYVQIAIRYRNGEMVSSSLSLHWSYKDGDINVSLAHGIADDPARGDVRRLLTSLGIPPTN